MVSTLFSSLNTNLKDLEGPNQANNENRPQPVLFVLQETMQIFKDIATLWANDLGVIEVCIRAFSGTIRCLFEKLSVLISSSNHSNDRLYAMD